jgi:peroxiredoxin
MAFESTRHIPSYLSVYALLIVHFVGVATAVVNVNDYYNMTVWPHSCASN